LEGNEAHESIGSSEAVTPGETTDSLHDESLEVEHLPAITRVSARAGRVRTARRQRSRWRDTADNEGKTLKGP
jgi:hypothetical protein